MKKQQKVKSENLIHIKLEFKEAIQSKEDLLTSQMKIIQIQRVLRKYKKLRLEELKLKLKLARTIKDAKVEISKLQKLLPEIKIPAILKDGLPEKKTRELEAYELPEKDLDVQLSDIQAKLRAIQK